MKYKVGDKVRVVKNTGKGAKNIDKYIGQVGKIVEICEGFIYPYVVLFKDGEDSGWNDEELSASTGGRPCKNRAVKFIVIYDEEDGDPTKKFYSKTELNKWLKEAHKDEDIVFDSIEVYSVDGKYEVLTSFRLRKRA